MARVVKLRLSILLVCFLISCKAQQTGLRITSTIVSIYNKSNKETMILLGPIPTRPDTFTLKANEVWHSPGYTRDPIIHIKSQNVTIEYQLKLGNSYMIYWRKEQKFWDLEKIKNR